MRCFTCWPETYNSYLFSKEVFQFPHTLVFTQRGRCAETIKQYTIFYYVMYLWQNVKLHLR